MTRLLGVAGAILLVSCGGGGGGSTPAPSGSGATGFAALPPAATLAQHCAAPRSGRDAVTGQTYTDVQGSLLDEQNWLASWTNDTYLWYSEVPYPSPASYSDTLSYFNVLKTTAKDGSGALKDKFHFTYPTATWEALATTGVQASYGFTVSLISASPPRSAVVAYTDPNTAATNLSVPIARGATILKVDGVDLVNDSTQSGVNTLNAGLFPNTAGESHSFVIQDLGASSPRTVTLVSGNYASAPVQNVKTLAGGSVGYLLFNDHLATAEPALINAVNQLKSAGVSDLVIDIRYNGGGYLDIASELAYMVAGPAQTSGKTFDMLAFNDKHPTIDPIALTPITPTPFYNTAVGFGFTPAGTVLPHLDLKRVFVLTGSGTCSASEAVMNGLRGVGVQVVQVGSTTCGKPYGFYPAENCGTTYFSIQFKGVNAQGFGDYADGFAPQNGAITGLATGAVLPGCSIGDDYSHALGDPAEARLAAALQYRNTASCSALTGSTHLNLLHTQPNRDGQVFKNPFVSNLIVRH